MSEAGSMAATEEASGARPVTQIEKAEGMLGFLFPPIQNMIHILVLVKLC